MPPSLLARPARNWHKVGEKKNILSVSSMMAERNISLSTWPGIAFVCACTCGYVHICLDIQAAFEQPLHQCLVALHRHSVSLPQGSSLHTGHMDNSIPVVELVIKKNKHTWPLSDSQGTRFLWTDMAANNTEEQLLPQTATGGRAHARPRRSRQTRPDKRRDRPLL